MVSMSIAAVTGPLGSERALLALAPLILLAVGLVAYCLVDIVRSPRVRLLPKPVWALIVVGGSFPLGAVAYLLWGRSPHDGRTTGFSPAELAELAAFEAAGQSRSRRSG
jgi:hypothetical protein